jgi:enamine deaminase RidA (YjgF/YER057c/UK114 family)
VRLLFSRRSIIPITLLLVLWTTTLAAAEPGTTTAVIPEYAESYPAYGVSESVRAGDFIYIGGIIATDRDGNVIAPNDGAAQARVVYGRIKTILEAHGASYKNVVSETIYLTDWDRFVAGADIRKKFFDEVGAAYPSAVGQEVVSLTLPGLVMEVQMVAYVGEKKAVGN